MKWIYGKILLWRMNKMYDLHDPNAKQWFYCEESKSDEVEYLQFGNVKN